MRDGRTAAAVGAVGAGCCEMIACDAVELSERKYTMTSAKNAIHGRTSVQRRSNLSRCMAILLAHHIHGRGRCFRSADTLCDDGRRGGCVVMDETRTQAGGDAEVGGQSHVREAEVLTGVMRVIWWRAGSGVDCSGVVWGRFFRGRCSRAQRGNSPRYTDADDRGRTTEHRTEGAPLGTAQSRDYGRRRDHADRQRCRELLAGACSPGRAASGRSRTSMRRSTPCGWRARSRASTRRR